MAASMKCSCRILRRSCRTFSRSYYVSSVKPSGQTSSSMAEKEFTPAKQEIVIPNQIKRDPLSILRSLSSCVQRDFNSPQYIYMDDPYLIPTSPLNKRTFALSKASGRKAAKFMLKEYPDFLDPITKAVPRIEALSPTKVVYEHNTDDEVALMERIAMRRVTDSFDMCKKIKDSGGDISTETLNNLLDLLCVYNSIEPSDELEPEEFWFKREIGQDNSRKIRKTWKEDGLANQLFDDMTEKNAETYCAMIRGTALYFDVDRAFALYQEMIEQQLPIDVSTFNALLSIAGLHRDSYDLKWELLEGLLKQMSTSGVQPNLETFNNVLSVISKMAKYRKSAQLALQTVNEMKSLGIEPSLGTWFYILQIFYPFPDSSSTILHDIMKYLEGKEFTLQDPSDVSFFTAAMTKACFNLRDTELAYKIDDFLNIGGNASLLGDASKESVYFSTFFRMLMSVEPLDKVMEYYERFVPNMWIPNFTAVDELLQTIELFDGFNHLPLIWSDMILFDYAKKEDILVPLLKLMSKKKQEPDLQQQFCDIAQNILQRIEDELQARKFTRFQPLRLNCTMLSYMVSIYVKGEQLDKAWELLEYYKKHNTSIAGLLSEDMLKELTKALIEQQQTERAVSCIGLLSELGYSQATEMAKLAKEKLTTLSESQRQHLDVMA